MGHLAKNYWYQKGSKGLSKEKNFEGANFAREDSDDYETTMLMATVLDEHVDSKIWFLDTRGSIHMTDQKVRLKDFNESNKRKERLANSSSLQEESA